jgi:hypothetical protein
LAISIFWPFPPGESARFIPVIALEYQGIIGNHDWQ